MTVPPEHTRLRAWVECEGEPLQEYDDDDDNDNDNDAASTNTITKYMESRSGAEFAVHFELERPFPIDPMLITVFLDGKSVSWRVVGDVQYKKAHGSLKRRFDSLTTRIAEGQCLVQKFCFSELQIDDSDDHVLEGRRLEDLKSLGLISLQVHYIKNLQTVPNKDRGIDKERSNAGSIPEKALKGRALTHRVGFGAAVNTPYTSLTHRTQYDYVDPRMVPFATFNFRYRSRAALRSLLIIPRSPSPVPLEDRDVNTLTFEESQELIRRMREREITSRNIKQERSVKREHSADRESGKDDDEVSFVSTAKRSRLHITVNQDGVETIDLT